MIYQCATCKKIRIGNRYVPFTRPFTKSEAKLVSHGACPECAAQQHQDIERRRELRRLELGQPH